MRRSLGEASLSGRGRMLIEDHQGGGNWMNRMKSPERETRDYCENLTVRPCQLRTSGTGPCRDLPSWLCPQIETMSPRVFACCIIKRERKLGDSSQLCLCLFGAGAIPLESGGSFNAGLIYAKNGVLDTIVQYASRDPFFFSPTPPPCILTSPHITPFTFSPGEKTREQMEQGPAFLLSSGEWSSRVCHPYGG